MSVQEKALIKTNGRYPVSLTDARNGDRCVYLLGYESDDVICGKQAATRINDDAFCSDHIAGEIGTALLFSAFLGDQRRSS